MCYLLARVFIYRETLWIRGFANCLQLKFFFNWIQTYAYKNKKVYWSFCLHSSASGSLFLHSKLHLCGPYAFITSHRASPASYHPCWLNQWWAWRTVPRWHWCWWISAGRGHYSVQWIWLGTACASSWCGRWGSAEFPTEVPECTSHTEGLAGLEEKKGEESLYCEQLTWHP